ncbi:type IX secretion system PorP/SprF family membrane protein [Roseivirga pacifica]|uniref:Type IX secretion system membrane protein, PorP/SprF family n=1 Tax=Roseivirga pacifica TaxID=1267423 RepID=A0A1I0NBM9_9BACT|nr:PorP/SprF family type IX secretion system membrane protein [Roseivirga pacifica]RKQ51056.1 type IX secretion system PorP/SprF family membrane protein [Roseivirga pacifica]SEV98380.1 type IX secretion system membrane protein, PorP/SprF family [Roseivirga pacifica]
MRLVLITALLFTFSIYTNAQQFNFSLIDFTEQRVNPAWLGMDGFWGASLVQRQQNRAADFRISSTSFQAVYPQLFPFGERIKGALGINLLNDVSGQTNTFKVQEAGLNYSLRIIGAKGQSLGLGVGLSNQNRGFDYAGVTTNMQYVTGRGFDLSIGSGENLISTKQNFNRVNAGIFWQQVNDFGRKLGHFGFSVFDLNRPVDSFYSDAVKFDPTYMLTAGLSIYENLDWSVSPELLIVYQVGGLIYNAGVSTTYTFDAEQSLAFKPRYLIGKDLILAAEFRKNHFVFGIAYDVPVSANAINNQGAIEFGIKYIGKVKERRRKKRRGARAIAPAVPNRAVISVPTIERAPMTSIQQLPIKAKGLKPVPDKFGKEGAAVIESELTIYFATNQTKLLTNFRQELEALVEDISLEGKKYLIVVEGHTDSTGPYDLNQRLSLKRAQIIANFLLEAGISPDLIKVFGRGESLPLSENSSAAGRAINRRVEVRLVTY